MLIKLVPNRVKYAKGIRTVIMRLKTRINCNSRGCRRRLDFLLSYHS
nr:MAG TPA: hypothetical protein [Caudoviricetes sp.]